MHDRLDLREVRRAAELRIAIRRFTHADDDAARTAGLTPKRYQLLLLIGASQARPGGEPLTVSQAADQLGVSLSAAAELAVRADRAGLIQRIQGTDDARVTTLRLTSEGNDRMLAAYAAAAPQEDALLHAVRRTAGQARGQQPP